ncbi:NERD domain-containing protein [Vibrio parahaemolyticus]|nr:NERD domain-containing protein [Vibrio parahaemolyticus]
MVIPLFFILIAIFIFAFVIGYVIGRLHKASSVNHGETLVRDKIQQNLSSEKYHLLNNITLPLDEGTTQIDHVLVSTRGVFIIETKHYSGWIFANENSSKWTQLIYKVKNSFQNPLRQNYLHLKTVKALLDFLPDDVFKPIVVFTGTAEFKTKRPEGVLILDELTDYINSHNDESISLNRVAFSVGRIECARYQLTEKTDIDHQRFLEKKFGRTNLD